MRIYAVPNKNEQGTDGRQRTNCDMVDLCIRSKYGQAVFGSVHVDFFHANEPGEERTIYEELYKHGRVVALDIHLAPEEE